jgi:hypothetical protein
LTLGHSVNLAFFEFGGMSLSGIIPGTQHRQTESKPDAEPFAERRLVGACPSEVRMRHAYPLATLTLIAFIPAAQAASDADCQSLWKTLDIDANGALEKSEDGKGYLAAMQLAGVKLAKPDVASRDEFLSYCRDKITNVKTESPQNSKDFGKGDLTPAKSALSASDVQKKLEANGFKNVRDLNLDDKGIWRGVADADVKNKFVAVDAQGDIMADAKGPPIVKSDKGEPSASDKATAAPDAAKMMVPKTENADNAMKPAPGEMSRDENAVGTDITKGSSTTSGLLVWVFLLVGNACALLFLNGLGGGTSAMGGGPRDPRLL